MTEPKYHIKISPKLIELFEKIAKEECLVETLLTRYRDSLDFSDVSSASLLCALNRAYNEGFLAGMEKAREIDEKWQIKRY